MAIQIGGGGGGSSPTATSLFDAAIYKSGTQTIAITRTGTVIGSNDSSKHTDNTLIQAALDYLDTISSSYTIGYTLLINSDHYYTSSEIQLRKPHKIIGSGRSNTIIEVDIRGSQTSILNINADNVAWGTSHASVQDLTLNGSGISPYGIRFGDITTANTGTENTVFQNLLVTGCLNHGIYDNSTYGSVYTNVDCASNNIISQLVQYTAGIGTSATQIRTPSTVIGKVDNYYNGWYLWNSTRSLGSPITGYTYIGYTINAAVANQTSGDLFYLIPNTGGICLDGVYGCKFFGCRFDNNANGIVIKNSYANEFVGCSATGNSFHGAYIASSGSGSPHHNYFIGLKFGTNAKYNHTYTATIGLNDIFVGDSACAYNTFTNIFSVDTYVPASFYCFGNYAVVMNYKVLSGSAYGTLGGIGSIDMNAVVGVGTFAPLADPILTGNPRAPTAPADTDTVQIATTQFMLGQASDTVSLMNGVAASGASERYARYDHVHPTDTTLAPISDPAFGGIPTVPTAGAGTNTIQAASTAFVTAAIATMTQTAVLYASAATIPATTPAAMDMFETSSYKNTIYYIGFNHSSTNVAQWILNMPVGWDGGNITPTFCWDTLSATGNTVKLNLSAKRVPAGTTFDVALPLVSTVTDTNLGAFFNNRKGGSAFTVTGTGTTILFSLTRDFAADTLVEEARITAIELKYNCAFTY